MILSLPDSVELRLLMNATDVFTFRHWSGQVFHNKPLNEHKKGCLLPVLPSKTIHLNAKTIIKINGILRLA